MRTRFHLLLALALIGGCAGGDTDSDGVIVDTGPAAELLGIGLSPRDPVLAVGEALTFQVRAFYDDTRNVDISDQVTWVVSEPRVLSLGEGGQVQALAPGTSDVIATDGRGVSTRTQVEVRGADDAPTAVVLAPRLVDVAVGGSVDLKAVATYGDGSTGNIAAACSWTSEGDRIATVDGRGSIQGVSEGRTTVRATCGSLSAAAPVTVRAADDAGYRPDLEIHAVEVEVVGDALTVLIDVKNTGQGMSPLGFVDLFLDSDGAPDADDTFVETDWVEPLAPGDHGLSLIVIDGLAPGDHTAWLVADADGWIDESDEGNNQSGPHPFRVGGRTGPQLVIDSFEALTDGESTLWFVEIRNAGDEVAKDFWVDLWWDSLDDPEVCETGDDFAWIDRLDPGDTVWWEPELDDAPVSSWISVVYVDSCDDVVESDEDDNLEYAWVE